MSMQEAQATGAANGLTAAEARGVGKVAVHCVRCAVPRKMVQHQSFSARPCKELALGSVQELGLFRPSCATCAELRPSADPATRSQVTSRPAAT